MWPRYPRLASRTGLIFQAQSTAPGLNRGAAATLGPSPTRFMRTAAKRAETEAAARVKRQSMPPRALNRCGVAEPRVSAPTSRPTTRPMSPLAQVAASFMPTG